MFRFQPAASVDDSGCGFSGFELLGFELRNLRLCDRFFPHSQRKCCCLTKLCRKRCPSTSLPRRCHTSWVLVAPVVVVAGIMVVALVGSPPTAPRLPSHTICRIWLPRLDMGNQRLSYPNLRPQMMPGRFDANFDDSGPDRLSGAPGKTHDPPKAVQM